MLTTSGLTALLVGMVMLLMKVVEYLIGRKKGKGNESDKKSYQGYNGFGERLASMEAAIATKLDVLIDDLHEQRQRHSAVAETLVDLRGHQVALSRQIEKLESLPGHLERLTDSLDALAEELRRSK